MGERGRVRGQIVVSDGRSTWTITSDGPDGATLTIHVVLDTNVIGTLVSPLLKMVFLRGDRQMGDDLYAYVVTGSPSAAKQKAVAKRAGRSSRR